VIPLQPESDPRRGVRLRQLLAFGRRIKPGVTIDQAHAELDSIRQNLRRQYPDAYAGKIGVIALPLTEEIVGNSRAMLITILGAVAVLLLIACVNLAGMSLARAAARQRELAVRSALGATRNQLIRLLLAESARCARWRHADFCWRRDRARWSLCSADLPRIHDLAIDSSADFHRRRDSSATGLCGLAPARCFHEPICATLPAVAGQRWRLNQSGLRAGWWRDKSDSRWFLLASAGCSAQFRLLAASLASVRATFSPFASSLPPQASRSRGIR
jgi:hypothetical protein